MSNFAVSSFPVVVDYYFSKVVYSLRKYVYYVRKIDVK